MRWAWAVGAAQQGQFLCFESLPDRPALNQLSHIPGKPEPVIFSQTSSGGGVSFLLALGLWLGGIQTFPTPLDFLVTRQKRALPAELSRILSQSLSRHTFLSSPIPSGVTRSPQSSCLARWAWVVNATR